MSTSKREKKQKRVEKPAVLVEEKQEETNIVDIKVRGEGVATKVKVKMNPSQLFVYNVLWAHVEQWDGDHFLLTSLSTSDRENARILALPKESPSKGNEASWKNVCRQIARNVTNFPTECRDCWFVKATKQSGKSKTTKGGTSCQAVKSINKQHWPTHQVTYAMFHDEFCSLIHHRCSRGSTRNIGDPVCINPFHLKPGVDAASNRDDEGCRYGFGPRCPHQLTGDICIWTSDNGIYLPCVNEGLGPNDCICNPTCYPNFL